VRATLFRQILLLTYLLTYLLNDTAAHIFISKLAEVARTLVTIIFDEYL